MKYYRVIIISQGCCTQMGNVVTTKIMNSSNDSVTIQQKQAWKSTCLLSVFQLPSARWWKNSPFFKQIVTARRDLGQISSIALSPSGPAPGGADGVQAARNAGDPGLSPGLGGSPKENGNPLQYSCLQDLMDTLLFTTQLKQQIFCVNTE